MEQGQTAAGGSLSIRTYTLTQSTHSHDYHQIVVPLSGSMTISFDGRSHAVAVGRCVIIPSGTAHSYSAPEQSRFLVADLGLLPPNSDNLADPCVAIGEDLLAFCLYAEVQLRAAADSEVADLLFGLFHRLIGQQSFRNRVDDRIMRAVLKIEEDLAAPHTAEELAAIACLGTSQFKALFRKHMGEPFGAFLTRRRMEQAKSLLMHTDTPVGAVAAEVGYEDPSAFSRRFRAAFGQSPRQVARGG